MNNHVKEPIRGIINKFHNMDRKPHQIIWSTEVSKIKDNLEIIKRHILLSDENTEKEWGAYQEIRKALGLEKDIA